jgi:4-hydroxy-tetrahydrodipicolinate reductase
MSASARETRVLVVGALGRMGERVRAALADADGLVLGAALEGAGHPGLATPLEEGVTVTEDLGKALDVCDVAIDFSLPASTLALLRAAARSGTPCVVGTTGFSDAERAELSTLGERLPLVWAPNFSVAVNVLAELVHRAAELLGPDYDAEIVELHHSAKRDAPSGTALWLGRAVAEGRGQDLEEHAVLARSGDTGARPEGAIGIQALRGGDNPGEHTVLFLGTGERLELSHRAFTRDHFARGAVRAARWLIGRPAGLYGMGQVLGLER